MNFLLYTFFISRERRANIDEEAKAKMNLVALRAYWQIDNATYRLFSFHDQKIIY